MSVNIVAPNLLIQTALSSRAPQTPCVRTPSPTTAAATKGNLRSIDELMGSIDLLGSGVDYAFVVYAMQIQQMDSNTAAAIKQIQTVGKLREQINARLNQLNQLSKYIQTTNSYTGTNDNKASKWEIYKAAGFISDKDPFSTQYDRVSVAGCGDSSFTKVDPNDPPAITQWNAAGGTTENKQAMINYLAAEQRGYKELALTQVDYATDLDTGEITATKGKELGHWEGDCFYITVNDVNAEIERLKNQATTLDSDRDIRMISVNSLLNKKEQAVTQLTNIIKKDNDTKSAIINNLK
jgi:hypothetical protein